MKFLIFYFSILPSAMHGGKRKTLNLCYQRKKKSQETLDFSAPVEIICQISKVINSSSSFPNGTRTNLPYGRFLCLG